MYPNILACFTAILTSWDYSAEIDPSAEPS